MDNGCPICGESSLAELSSLNLAYLRCGACASLSLPPSASSPSQIGSDPPEVEKAKEAIYRSGLDLLETLSPRGPLLDVGAGNGGFLTAARERGWTPSGVEPDPAAAARARSLGLEVFTGVLSDLPPGACYSAVTLWDSLDMLPDPLQGLVMVREALEPGGVVLARVRNPSAHLFLRRWLGGWASRLPSISPTFHRYGLSARGLRVLFERAGLETVSVANSKLTSGDPYASRRGPGRNLVAAIKNAVAGAAAAAEAASGGSLLWGASLIAVARRPKQ